jgi:hypothetical protein
MSDEDDWDFAGGDDAMLMILAAVRYLLENASASDRGDVVTEIIEIACQGERDLSVDRSKPFNDETPAIAPP